MLLQKAETARISEWTERLTANKAGLGLAVDVDKGRVTALHLTNGTKDAPTMVIPVELLDALPEVAERLKGAPKP